MRRRLTITCLCFAWICANGAIWDAAQVVAWGRMFAGYVRVEPVSDALQDTFDPSKPCEWCRAIKNVPNGEKSGPALPHTELSKVKNILAVELLSAWVFSNTVADWLDLVSSVGRTRIELVPVPPPRAWRG